MAFGCNPACRRTAFWQSCMSGWAASVTVAHLRLFPRAGNLLVLSANFSVLHRIMMWTGVTRSSSEAGVSPGGWTVTEPDEQVGREVNVWAGWGEKNNMLIHGRKTSQWRIPRQTRRAGRRRAARYADKQSSLSAVKHQTSCRLPGWVLDALSFCGSLKLRLWERWRGHDAPNDAWKGTVMHTENIDKKTVVHTESIVLLAVSCQFKSE